LVGLFSVYLLFTEHNVSSTENQQQTNQQSEVIANSASQIDELANEWDPKVWEPMDNVNKF
jgi:hypothetical protein